MEFYYDLPIAYKNAFDVLVENFNNTADDEGKMKLCSDFSEKYTMVPFMWKAWHT